MLFICFILLVFLILIFIPIFCHSDAYHRYRCIYNILQSPFPNHHRFIDAPGLKTGPVPTNIFPPFSDLGLFYKPSQAGTYHLLSTPLTQPNPSIYVSNHITPPPKNRAHPWQLVVKDSQYK